MKVSQKKSKIIIQPKALLIGVLLSFVILSVRMMLTNDYYFYFLPWNLFLAFVPLFLAYRAVGSASGKRKLPLFLWIVSWLFFFPNAPYVITDVLHLFYYNSFELASTGLSRLYDVTPEGVPNWIFWYDLFTIGFYSVLSWVAGLCSLQSILKSHLGLVNKQWKQIVFFLSALTLSGFGIFLGRFLRFNTWDIVARPLVILKHLFNVFTHELIFQIAFVTTMSFALALIVSFVLFDSKFVFEFGDFKVHKKMMN